MAVIDGKWLSKEGLTYFWSKIKAIFTKQTETNVIANLGAKNLLLVTGTTSTVRAVTYTVNDDGTITANGQASANADWNVNSSFHLESGTYKLTGCPAGGNNSSKYKLQIQGIGYDTGDGLTFTVNSATNVNVYIRVWSGYNASDLVFKPMISRAEITDDTFQPYAPTNRELYETKTEQTETNVIANAGAKNRLLITNKNDTLVVNGITFTKNADQTITATGSATANADYPLNSALSLVIGQKYTLSGCPTGGGVDNFFLRQLSGAIDYGDGVTFTAESSSANFFIRIRNGYTIQGSLTFKPMLRPAEITDDTFEPYAKTNADLTNENENQQLEIDYAINTGAKNLFNINAVQTANHVTSSLSDGVLTVTSSGNWAHYSVPVNLPAGDYIFTTTISNFSRASGAAATSVRMRIATSTSGGTATALVTVSGNGPLEIPFTWAGGQLYVQYYPNYSATTTYVSSFTASNSMIRRAEITDGTFQPYAPTNRELYETRFASKTILPNDVDLNDIKTGGIYNGVTSTGNSAVHMPVANGSFYFVLTVIELNESIIQIFKQLNSAGDPNLYIRRFFIYNNDWDSWYQFTGTQV